MDVPKTAGIPNGHVEEVDEGVFEVVLLSELDAKGIVAFLEQVETLTLKECRYEPDDDGERWLVHVQVLMETPQPSIDRDYGWECGFVAGLMAGWQRAAEGD